MSEYKDAIRSIAKKREKRLTDKDAAHYSNSKRMTDNDASGRMTDKDKSDMYAKKTMRESMRFYLDRYKKKGEAGDKKSLRHIRDKYKKRFGK